MTISDETLQKDIELCSKATPDPWIFTKDNDGYFTIIDHDGHDVIISMCESEFYASNFSFIARARTALPAYIAEVKRLREQIGDMEDNDAVYMCRHEVDTGVACFKTSCKGIQSSGLGSR